MLKLIVSAAMIAALLIGTYIAVGCVCWLWALFNNEIPNKPICWAIQKVVNKIKH